MASSGQCSWGVDSGGYLRCLLCRIWDQSYVNTVMEVFSVVGVFFAPLVELGSPSPFHILNGEGLNSQHTPLEYEMVLQSLRPPDIHTNTLPVSEGLCQI